jgi:hypothetical protein
MSKKNEVGGKCLRNIVEEWEDNRKWLDENGFREKLKDAVSGLHALKWSLIRLSEAGSGDYELEGIASLIDAVAVSLDDMAHGRTSDMVLPKR